MMVSLQEQSIVCFKIVKDLYGLAPLTVLTDIMGMILQFLEKNKYTNFSDERLKEINEEFTQEDKIEFFNYVPSRT